MKNQELILAKHPFFQSMPEEYTHSVAMLAKTVDFEEGDILFEEGEEANKFYLIIKGRVAIKTFLANKGVITIQTVEDGEILGWSWFVPPYKYRFDAKALTKTQLIVINGAELRNQCENDEQLGYELMKRMVHAIATRLEETRLMLLDLYGKPSK